MLGSMPTIVGSVEVSGSAPELVPGVIGEPAGPGPAVPGVVTLDAPELVALSGFAVPGVDAEGPEIDPGVLDTPGPLEL
jgi:hypothetical protein